MADKLELAINVAAHNAIKKQVRMSFIVFDVADALLPPSQRLLRWLAVSQSLNLDGCPTIVAMRQSLSQ